MKTETLFIALCLFITFSCEQNRSDEQIAKERDQLQKIEFKEIFPSKPLTEESLLANKDLVRIKSYKVIFNAKARGDIELLLENNRTYKANDIQGGSFVSVLAMLKEPGVAFHNVGDKLVLIKELIPSDSAESNIAYN